MALSHKPQVLYRASVERIAGARRAFADKDYPLSMYLSGLAVECILQAVALRHGAAHDARHSLLNWLVKCPAKLQDAIKGKNVDDWNKVVSSWDNGIRYLSRDGLIGYLRERGFAIGIAGGAESVLRKNARTLLDSATAVHRRGADQWLNSTRK